MGQAAVLHADFHGKSIRSKQGRLSNATFFFAGAIFPPDSCGRCPPPSTALFHGLANEAPAGWRAYTCTFSAQLQPIHYVMLVRGDLP